MKYTNHIILTAVILFSFVTSPAEKLLDYDGDGISDFVVLRPNGPNLDWYVHQSTTGGHVQQQWGLSEFFDTYDWPIAADFDGDLKSDITVWRATNTGGTFYILNSASATLRQESMGFGSDWPMVTADYDGDGRDDPAVFRRSNLPTVPTRIYYRGTLNNPNNQDTAIQLPGFGPSIYPYTGDFDGDGKTDMCLFINTTTPKFTIKRSSDGVIENVTYGKQYDGLAPGDYDGDGRTDFCVMRKGKWNKMNWHIKERDGGGTPLNIPIVFGSLEAWPGFDNMYGGGDFDGDGRSDIGVYRDSTAPNIVFSIRRSSNGSTLTMPWGLLGDRVVGFNFITLN